jgi:hypothetical protein
VATTARGRRRSGATHSARSISWGIGVGLAGPGSKLERRWGFLCKVAVEHVLDVRHDLTALDRSLHGCTGGAVCT